MRTAIVAATVLVACVAAQADTFGTGANEFNIDFVTISGDTNPASGIPAGQNGFLFTGVNNDYRMGTYEITNDQWSKFQAELGVPVTGDPANAYYGNPSGGPPWPGTSVPTSTVSWYEAAQFVNYLNTFTGHQTAYKFTGTQGTSGYALDTWDAAEADGGTNLYRHKDAFYFLPTADEWVKAAYWNGSILQTYATKAGESLHQGDGTSGAGWNYYDDGWVFGHHGPWDVGSGSEELNGTFDMMGNIHEWMESPYSTPGYGTDSYRELRGGWFSDDDNYLASSYRHLSNPDGEGNTVGFRIAAAVPGPATMGMLALGGLAMVKKRRGQTFVSG